MQQNMRGCRGLILVVLFGSHLVACEDNEPKEVGRPMSTMPAPAASLSSGVAPAAGTGGAMPHKLIAGNVAETMNSGGFTYIQVNTEAGTKVWAAAPQVTVKVGDQVSFAETPPFEGFHSSTLNRDFPSIYFVDRLVINGVGTGALTSGHASDAKMAAIENADKAGKADKAEKPAMTPTTAKPAGSKLAASKPDAAVKGSQKGTQKVKDLADLYARRLELSGATVTVKGKVVKVNNEIMGRNWLHISDDTLKGKDKDLTVTTSATVKMGDQVTMTGKIATDKDFGSGYFFAVILEDATPAP